MKHLSPFTLFVLLLGLSFGSVPAKAAPPVAGDARDILGVWKGGMPGEPPGSIELTITPERITGRNSRNGESLGEGTYQLDPARKTIDVVRVEKFGRGRKYIGLYSLKAALSNGSPPRAENNARKTCATARSAISISWFSIGRSSSPVCPVRFISRSGHLTAAGR